MINLNDYLTIENIAIIFNTLIIFILLILNITNRSKINKLNKKYEKFMNGLSDRNIEDLIQTYIEKTRKLDEKNTQTEHDLKVMNIKIKNCIQKVGIVRFSAFEDVGSDLSYSVALIDENNNGVVLTSIFTRDSSSTYAKPIVEGNSKYKLSAEEIRAIEDAKRITKQ